MKRLGIDLGTSSLGWAILDDERMLASPIGDAATSPIDCGVVIFPEGMDRDKSDNLKSPAALRRSARAMRRLIYRRKLRKFHLLQVLIENGMCPLSAEGLAKWKAEGCYPVQEEAFMAWVQASNDHNPYADRAAAAERTVDPLTLGRALYHIAQRRGFKSSKKEQLEALPEEGKAGKNGKKSTEATQTKQAIDTLTQALEAESLTLGQYFYKLFLANAAAIAATGESGTSERIIERIRGRKTGRLEHYQKEFEVIAEKQALPLELKERLASILFFQRPLRIQRHTVGYCALEKGKSARKYRRCLKSHPTFEYYRALCFLNNLRVGETLQEGKDRLQNGEGTPLSAEERAKVLAALCEKDNCTVEELFGKKKLLLGKKVYTNYRPSDDAPVMPIRARFMKLGIPEAQWQMALNAAMDFEDLEKLMVWAQKPETLGLEPKAARTFARMRFSTDRADYSLHAIRKIIPYLERGFTLRKATFCAKLGDIIPAFEEKREQVLQGLCDCERNYAEEKARRVPGGYGKVNPLETYHYKRYLAAQWDVSEEAFKQLYVDLTETDEANPVLPPVNLGAIRNPLSCRSLTVLRRLVNTLRKTGKIDAQTQIFIELAHTVNSANDCRAIELYQKEQKAKREEAAAEVQNIIDEHHLSITVNEDTILRYLLWEEQEKCCVYTGQPISQKAIFTDCDIEHTIPRSRGGTNELENLTLCFQHYNRNVKKGKLPSECPNATEAWFDPETKEEYPALQISKPLKQWRDALHGLQKKLEKKPKRGGDVSIYNQQRIKWLLSKRKRDYLKKKLETFTITRDKVEEKSFIPRQMVDTGIITTQAVKFLKSRYRHVYTRNGAVTAAARKAWGIQKEDEKKARVDHIHHAVDACVIAALDPKAFTEICTQLGKNEKTTRWNAVVPPPYEDFARRINAATESVLVRHLPLNRQVRPIGKRRQRVPLSVKKQLKLEKKAPAKAQKTLVVRGSLHNDTLYGKIKIAGEETVVLRKTISALGNDLKKNVANVVDKAVREALEQQIATYEAQGIAVKDLPNQRYHLPSGIPIKKIRVKISKPKNPDALRAQAFAPDKPVYGSGSDALCLEIVQNDKGVSVPIYRTLLQEVKETRSDEEKRAVSFKIYPMQLALTYEKSPDELKMLSGRELSKRLYVVRKVTDDGRTKLYYHREARRSTVLGEELKAMGKNKEGASNVNFSSPEPLLLVTKGVFLEHMLFEGVHFTLSMDGKIEWIDD